MDLLERSRATVLLRCYGFCEGCGLSSVQLDVHHRQARGAGGVSGTAAEVANSVQNLLALCRSCHDETEHAETWILTEQLGWRIPHWVPDPREVPALIYTVNGRAWWQLNEDGFRWLDWPATHRLTWDSRSR